MIVREGVFPLLYQHQLRQPIPLGTELSVSQLLGYSFPVGLQYEESAFGRVKTILCNCASRIDSTDAWTLLAIPKAAEVSAHPSLGPTLAAQYHEIEPPKDFALTAFGFHAVATDTK